MRTTFKVIEEAGYTSALLGMGLSHGLTSGEINEEVTNRLFALAKKLAPKDGGHNKFLESIVVWIDCRAPRYWWQEADTYRVGSTKQSESTMHTIFKNPLSQEDFDEDLPPEYFEAMSWMLEVNGRLDGGLTRVKNMLPEGFLQRRIWCVNYKTLRTIIMQRETHRLPQWKLFCSTVRSQVQHPELLP